MTFRELPQQYEPYRLSRHELHDPRSRDYDAATLVKRRPLVTTEHKRSQVPWDQGPIGSCTAHMGLGLLVTAPFAKVGKAYTETNCQDLYSLETTLDNSQIPGVWPPYDTGSTCLWTMKAMKRLGLIRSYRHAFSLQTVEGLLMDYPVGIGINWYDSMFNPDRNGVITISSNAQVAGGHALDIVGIDVERKMVKIANSWGISWGMDGYCFMSIDMLARLLNEGGDAVVPVM